MVWRTKGCGSGAGCDDTQPTPLCIIQGQPLDVSFVAGFPVAGQSVRAEIRHQPYGRLILDMAPYASVDPVDPNLLRIQLPAEVTAGVHSDGWYDVWVASQRIERGPAFLELSISALPPRQALTGSWSPIMVAGQPFERDLLLAGLFPPGEEISQEHGPDLNIEDPSGKEVVWFIGTPELTVLPDGSAIRLALSAEDITNIGPGRFTYKLHAWNTLHELRTLMAGVLMVYEEGACEMPVIDNGSTVLHVTPPPPPVVTPLLTVDPQFLFPGTYDFSVYRGDTYEWWFTLKAWDPLSGGLAPIDIAGWRFKAEIRPSPDGLLMAALQEMARDETAGIIAMRLTNDQSRQITSSGVWDLEAILPDGWVRTVLHGRVTLVTDVTTGKIDYTTGYGR